MQIWLEKDALVESYGTQRFVYGRWDTIFQFWIWERGGSTREWLPKWPVINPFGELCLSRSWLSWDVDNILDEELDYCFHPDSEGAYDDDPERSRLHQEMLYIFKDYVQLIPYEKRVLAGRFQRWQWAILKAIKIVPEFEEFLKTELVNRTPRFIEACLEYGYERSQRERNGFQNLIHRIMHQKRGCLLSQLSGKDWPKFGVRLLDKTYPEPSKGELDLLCTMIRGSNTALALSRTKFISSEFLICLDEIDAMLVHPAVVYAYNDCYVINAMLELSCELKQISSPRFMQAVSESFATVRSSEDILDRCDKFLGQIAVNFKPFPQPPFKGTKTFQAIETLQNLRKEGREMLNCVGEDSCLRSVINDEVYYFRWLGREKATVEFIRTKQNEWLLSQVKARENRPVSRKTLVEIQTKVNQLAPPGIIKPH